METNHPEKIRQRDKNLGQKTHRKTVYYSELHDERAYNFALLGWTGVEIAQGLMISHATFHRWLKQYPTFRESVYTGVDIVLGKVAGALYKSAIGYTAKKQVPFVDRNGDEHTVEVEEYIGPNVAACKMILLNRDPNHWSDKVQLEHTGQMIVTMDLTGEHESTIDLTENDEGEYEQ